MTHEAIWPNEAYEALQRERDRYRDALRKICDTNQCHWRAAAMFHIAEGALQGFRVDASVGAEHE